jgi:hypothetical protein
MSDVEHYLKQIVESTKENTRALMDLERSVCEILRELQWKLDALDRKIELEHLRKGMVAIEFILRDIRDNLK